jgi:hypothetical protein
MPSVRYVNGLPKIEPEIYKSLLTSKLNELRSRLGLSRTPKAAPRLISSWINHILKNTSPLIRPSGPTRPKPTQGKSTTRQAEARKAKKNPAPVFVPVAQTESTPRPALPTPVETLPDILNLPDSELLQLDPSTLSSTDCVTYCRASQRIYNRVLFKLRTPFVTMFPAPNGTKFEFHPECLPYLTSLSKVCNLDVLDLFVFDWQLDTTNFFVSIYNTPEPVSRTKEAHSLFVSPF